VRELIPEKDYEDEEVFREFANNGKIAFLLGDVDTGKTTFIKNMVNYLADKGLKIGIVDGDIGQSSIGPPSTIGFSLIENKIKSIEDIQVKSFYFVGAISPVKHLLPCVVGIKKMVDYGLSLSADRLIIDTTGFVRDSTGIALKQAKIELLRPDFILSFSRKSELEPILSSFRYISYYKIRDIKISNEVSRKSPDFRSSERERKFLSYFNKSRKLRLNLQTTGLSGAFFMKGGTPLHTNDLRWISGVVDFPVSYAEKAGDRLIIQMPHLCELKNLYEIKTRYGVSDVVSIDPLLHLTGCIGEDDEHLSIGVITDFRPKNNLLEILSPFSGSVQSIKRIHFGSYKLPEDIYSHINEVRL